MSTAPPAGHDCTPKEWPPRIKSVQESSAEELSMATSHMSKMVFMCVYCCGAWLPEVQGTPT